MDIRWFFRKRYLKIRVFFYTRRKFFKALFWTLALGAIAYYSINTLLFKNYFVGNAFTDKLEGNYQESISYYDKAQWYYDINHFSEDNKDIYFKIPYEKAVCYLKLNQPKKSISTMVSALTAIENEYGVYSEEMAHFIRKYLIEFYLQSDDVNLAYQEFKNLLDVYKHIGFSDPELADIMRLSGDIYYQKGQIDEAIELYQKAYKSAALIKQMDYDVFFNIVDRVTDYMDKELKNQQLEDIFKQSINVFTTAEPPKKEMAAAMLLKYGDYLAKHDHKKEAVDKYYDALMYIRHLPRSSYLQKHSAEYIKSLKQLYDDIGQFHKVRQLDIEMAKKRRFSF